MTAPILEIRPQLVDGNVIRRARVEVVIISLLAPFFLCTAAFSMPFYTGATVARLLAITIGCVGLLMIIGGIYYVVTQHLTRIQLGANLVLNSVGLLGRSCLVLEAKDIQTYESRPISSRDQQRLRIALGIAMIILVLGWVAGTILFLLLLYGIRYGTPNYSRVVELTLVWTGSIVLVTVVSLPGLMLIPLGWRLLASNGWLTIRYQVLGRSLPTNLRIFSPADDLETLEAWLIEHGVQRRDGPS